MIFTLQVPDRLNVNLIWPHVRFTGLLLIGPTWKRSGTRRCNFGAYPCLPALLYGLEACPLRRSDITSLDFVVNRFYMKLFQTNKIDIVNYCRAQFEFDLYT